MTGGKKEKNKLRSYCTVHIILYNTVAETKLQKHYFCTMSRGTGAEIVNRGTGSTQNNFGSTGSDSTSEQNILREEREIST